MATLTNKTIGSAETLTNKDNVSATLTNKTIPVISSHLWSADNQPWTPDTDHPWLDEENTYNATLTNKSL